MAFDPLDVAREHFSTCGEAAHVVGGRVRDALLGRETPDTDVVVAARAWEHAQAIAHAAGGAFVGLDKERDIARVVWPPSGRPEAILDLAGLAGPDLRADLCRRDFTVNAMAVKLEAAMPPAAGDIVDPLGGQRDLAAKCLRMTSARALDADSLRLLRGPRLAAELGLTIDPATRAAIRRRASKVTAPARERIREEVLRLIAAPDPAAAVTDLGDLGLLLQVLPEVAACGAAASGGAGRRTRLDEALAVLSALAGYESWRVLSRGGAVRAAGQLAKFRVPLVAHLEEEWIGGHRRATWLRLAAVLRCGMAGAQGADAVSPVPQGAGGGARAGLEHAGPSGPDTRAAKQLVARLAVRLRLGNLESTYLATVLRCAGAPAVLAAAGGVDRRAAYRYYRTFGRAGVDGAVLALASAVVASGPARKPLDAVVRAVDSLLHAWFEAYDRWVAPPPLVTGDTLMADLGLEPGPEVGRILSAIHEAQAAGEVDSVAGALELGRRLQVELTGGDDQPGA